MTSSAPTKAPGFCTCARDFPERTEFHPPAGATWHYLCDKPTLAAIDQHAEIYCRTCGFRHPAEPDGICPRWAPEVTVTRGNGQPLTVSAECAAAGYCPPSGCGCER